MPGKHAKRFEFIKNLMRLQMSETDIITRHMEQFKIGPAAAHKDLYRVHGQLQREYDSAKVVLNRAKARLSWESLYQRCVRDSTDKQGNPRPHMLRLAMLALKERCAMDGLYADQRINIQGHVDVELAVNLTTSQARGQLEELLKHRDRLLAGEGMPSPTPTNGHGKIIPIN